MFPNDMTRITGPKIDSLDGNELIYSVKDGRSVVITPQVLADYIGGVGGATTFISLTDTPSSYSGQALKVVSVKSDETGLEFTTGGGSGTVTSFSSGNLSPLFTTSVATATTTPALTFALSTQTANKIFAGPTTGGAATPTFRTLVSADIPTLAYWPLTGSATLTGNTDIDGHFDLRIGFNSQLSNFYVGSDAYTIEAVTGSSSSQITASSTIVQLRSNATLDYVIFTVGNVAGQTTFEDSRATKTGIEYSADYSATLVDRSLIDRGTGDGRYFRTANAAALTRTSDTNVTLTLGGSPNTSLLAATSITVGWTGTLAYARFVDGAGLSIVGRSTNSSGVQADITAGSDFNILRRSGTSIGFGSIDLSQSGAVGSTILAVANGGTGVSSGAYLLASGGTASGANTNIYTTTNTLTNQWSSLGTTIQTSAGELLNNSTDAAAGAQQISPLTIWRGRGWKTNATAASQTTDFAAYVLPVQGAANPTAFWKLDYSINGAAFTNGMAFGTEGGGFFVGTTSPALGVSNDIAVFLKGQNTTTALNVINTTSGTAANASILIGNSTGSGAHILLRTFSAGFSTTGMSVANTAQINSTLTGGLNIGCTGSAQVSIWTNNTQRISVTSGGLTFFGGSTAATAFIDIAAGVTGNAQLRLRAGVAPSSPNDGDMWYEDTNDRLMFRKAATGEVLLATAVTTEAVASDTTLTITFNGTTYKLLARA